MKLQEPIQAIVDKAHERLESAEKLLEIGNFSDSISRSYYAVLDILRALLVIDKVFPKSHAGTITKFHQLYIKSGKVKLEYGKILTSIEKSRSEADYDFLIKFTKKEAAIKFRQAKQFVKIVEDLLDKKNKTVTKIRR